MTVPRNPSALTRRESRVRHSWALLGLGARARRYISQTLNPGTASTAAATGGTASQNAAAVKQGMDWMEAYGES